MGHFPVCGWLRIATTSIKRQASTVSKGWNDTIENALIYHVFAEKVTRAQERDLVGGNWCVSGHEVKVWMGVSLLATAVALEVNGGIVEDFCWLCPAGDKHIKLAELDAMFKGINLVLSNGR